ITSAELIVRCGVLMNRHIPLGAIDEVRPDRNPASAPAWSLDRLRIDYRSDDQPVSILISPADKVLFMQDLMAGGMKMRGDHLVRALRLVRQVPTAGEGLQSDFSHPMDPGGNSSGLFGACESLLLSISRHDWLVRLRSRVIAICQP